MKKITKIVLCLSIVLLLTGCSSSKKETKKEEVKGKCKIKDCINLIGLNDNLEKVNETIILSPSTSLLVSGVFFKQISFLNFLSSRDTIILPS